MKKRSCDNQIGNGDEDMRIIEDRIHPEVFQEFYGYLDEYPNDLNPEVIDDIKRTLVKLARSGTIET